MADRGEDLETLHTGTDGDHQLVGDLIPVYVDRIAAGVEGHHELDGIGVVVPVTNTNLEPDVIMLAPQGVSVHFTRAGGYDVDAIPDETQMREYSDAHSDDLFDDLRHCRADVILYGCTSATLAHGPAYDAAFRRRIEQRTGIPATTAAAALVGAMRDLGVSTFAFSSPYVKSLNDLAIEFIEAHGFRCVGRADTPEPLFNEDVAALTPEQVQRLAERADREEADAIVLSCTDLRATEAIVEIEAGLQKPVVTSNQAIMVWALRRLGIAPDTAPLKDQRLGKWLSESLAETPGRAVVR